MRSLNVLQDFAQSKLPVGGIAASWPIPVLEHGVVRAAFFVYPCSHDPKAPTPPPCMDENTRIARGAFASPVLADMDKDGKLDIIQAAFDGKIYVFHADGTDVAGWPVEVHYSGALASEPQRNRTKGAATDRLTDAVGGAVEKRDDGVQRGVEVGRPNEHAPAR